MTASSSPSPARPRRAARPRRPAGESVVRVDLGLYPLPVLHATAWSFLHRAYVFLAAAGSGAVEVKLRSKPGAEPIDLAGEFGNELVNQRQRAVVARRNERLRDLIIGRAIVGAQPADQPWPDLGDDQLDDDYRDDPLQIAVPWEERYGAGAAGAGGAEPPPAADAATGTTAADPDAGDDEGRS